MIKAAFFDFNGTLYFDHDINRLAWKQTIDSISDSKIDFDSFYEQFKSVMNYIVIENAYKQINKPYTKQEVDYWVKEKEVIYQKYGIEHNRTHMPDGAIKLLDYLKEKNIPVILCTSSVKENVDFYYKYFNLSKWFNKEETVYDTGEYKDKIEMYKECARRLSVNPKDVVVFEDSPKSIKEAIVSGCDKIIALKRDDTPKLPEIKQIIKDYTELDYSIFD